MSWGDRGSASPRERRVLAASYYSMLRANEESVRNALAVLSDRSTYPAVLCCSSGVKRTGMVTTLVLGLLGVSDEVIVEEFASTMDARLRGIGELTSHQLGTVAQARVQLRSPPAGRRSGVGVPMLRGSLAKLPLRLPQRPCQLGKARPPEEEQQDEQDDEELRCPESSHEQVLLAVDAPPLAPHQSRGSVLRGTGRLVNMREIPVPAPALSTRRDHLGQVARPSGQKPSCSLTRMAVTRPGATTLLMIRMLFTPLGTPYMRRARSSSSGKQYS